MTSQTAAETYEWEFVFTPRRGEAVRRVFPTIEALQDELDAHGVPRSDWRYEDGVKVGGFRRFHGDVTRWARVSATPQEEALTLKVHVCDQRRSYVATFSTEDQAIEFITARTGTHAVDEIEESPIPDGWDRLYDLLYPMCEHGLRHGCAGPQHYPYDDDELRGMGAWL